MTQLTVGKPVWFWPNGATDPGAPYDKSNQPFAATITFVHIDSRVNVVYFDWNGCGWPRQLVDFWQVGTPRPKSNFCEFMHESGRPNVTIPTESAALTRPVLSLKKPGEK